MRVLVRAGRSKICRGWLNGWDLDLDLRGEGCTREQTDVSLPSRLMDNSTAWVLTLIGAVTRRSDQCPVARWVGAPARSAEREGPESAPGPDRARFSTCPSQLSPTLGTSIARSHD